MLTNYDNKMMIPKSIKAEAKTICACGSDQWRKVLGKNRITYWICRNCGKVREG